MFLGPQGKALHRGQDWLANKAMPQEAKDLEAKQRAETVQATMRGRVTKALYTKECVDPFLLPTMLKATSNRCSRMKSQRASPGPESELTFLYAELTPLPALICVASSVAPSSSNSSSTSFQVKKTIPTPSFAPFLFFSSPEMLRYRLARSRSNNPVVKSLLSVKF